MTAKFGWSKNVLVHQIENQTYEKTLLNQTNFDKAVTPAIRAQAKLAVKDEYLFDFLELGEEHAERDLQRALIARIEDFLRAMGGLFAFVGSQFRLEVEEKEYFIDLLLFHRRLKCLIFGDNLLALKALEQEYTGKIKCAYIDPPYNTGSAFEHYDDGVEHSIWLSLMRDRIELMLDIYHWTSRPVMIPRAFSGRGRFILNNIT